jgi:hypothetical protein
MKISQGRAALKTFGNPLMEINTKIFRPWQEIIKRGFDIYLAFLY